jgi:hypothetical protein
MTYSNACAHCGCLSDKKISIFKIEKGMVVPWDDSSMSKLWVCPACGHINQE